MNISASLRDNIDAVKTLTHHCQDILLYEFTAGKDTRCAVCFIDGMVNKETVNKFVIQPLQQAKDAKPDCRYLVENVTSNAEDTVVSTLTEALDAVLSGDAALFVDGDTSAVKIGSKGYKLRSIDEPPSSAVIKGPREGFLEDVKQNTVLLRRRLKSPDLVIDFLKVGKYSNTTIALAHLDGVADAAVLETLRDKIAAIDTDGILDSSYIATYLDERPGSLFRQVGTTEKPDVLASRLLEGRVAIFVDGSPIVLTVPYMLLEDFQSAQDYYDRPLRATFSRFLRFFGVMAAVLLPALYVAAQLFHLQLIPLRFLVKIMGSMREIPLPPSLEMFFVLMIFEVLKESSVRMPKYVGMALSVVGALVLGETAVSAGIVSTPSILIMALSGIAMYTVPDQEGTLSLLRIVFLILAGCFGVFGILAGVAALSTYLVCLSGYGTPYLAPYAPRITSDLKDGFVKHAYTEMTTRPLSIRSANRTRMKNRDRRNTL